MIPLQIDAGFIASFIVGGIGAMAWAIVQVYRALKSGAAADEQDEYARMERAATYENARRKFAEDERDYWHRRSASMEYELTRATGLEAINDVLEKVGPAPEPPKPPSPAAKTKRKKPLPGYDDMMDGYNGSNHRQPRPQEDDE